MPSGSAGGELSFTSNDLAGEEPAVRPTCRNRLQESERVRAERSRRPRKLTELKTLQGKNGGESL